jgi:hypothetical protein
MAAAGGRTRPVNFGTSAHSLRMTSVGTLKDFDLRAVKAGYRFFLRSTGELAMAAAYSRRIDDHLARRDASSS